MDRCHARRPVADSLAVAPDTTRSASTPGPVDWRGTYAASTTKPRQLIASCVPKGSARRRRRLPDAEAPRGRRLVLRARHRSLHPDAIVSRVWLARRSSSSSRSGADTYIAPAPGHVDYTPIIDEMRPRPVTACRVSSVTAPPRDPPRRRSSRRMEATSRVATGDRIFRPRRPTTSRLAYTSRRRAIQGVIHAPRTMLSELQHIAGWGSPRPNLMAHRVAHATGVARCRSDHSITAATSI